MNDNDHVDEPALSFLHEMGVGLVALRCSGYNNVDLAAVCCGPLVESAEPVGLKFDLHDGYFVSNKFEPNAAESYLLISTQEQFDQVFGAAFVMGDRAHRLPEKAFEKLMVLAVVKRGQAMVEYHVKAVEAVDGVVQLHYTAARKPQASAEFACPLIVSIPRGDYRAVRFIEGGRPVATITIGDRGRENNRQ